MQSLLYGYKKPTTGDKGSDFFPALEDNIEQLSEHNHDGVNSAPLSSSAVVALTGPDLASGGWVSVADGTYRQLVTMPGGLTIAPYIPCFKISGGADDLSPVYPKIVKNSDFSFYVYVNDPTLNLKVYYTT